MMLERLGFCVAITEGIDVLLTSLALHTSSHGKVFTTSSKMQSWISTGRAIFTNCDWT